MVGISGDDGAAASVWRGKDTTPDAAVGAGCANHWLHIRTRVAVG
jgi:hypothetical protein